MQRKCTVPCRVGLNGLRLAPSACEFPGAMVAGGRPSAAIVDSSGIGRMAWSIGSALAETNHRQKQDFRKPLCHGVTFPQYPQGRTVGVSGMFDPVAPEIKPLSGESTTVSESPAALAEPCHASGCRQVMRPMPGRGMRFKVAAAVARALEGCRFASQAAPLARGHASLSMEFALRPALAVDTPCTGTGLRAMNSSERQADDLQSNSHLMQVNIDAMRRSASSILSPSVLGGGTGTSG